MTIFFRRSVLVAMACLGLGVALLPLTSVRAETDYKAQAVIRDIQQGANNDNQIRVLRVRDSVELPSGSVGTSSLSNNAVTGGKLASGVISQRDTNTTTTVTLYSATSVGQILFGRTGSSNRTWYATATGTNGWVQVEP